MHKPSPSAGGAEALPGFAVLGWELCFGGRDLDGLLDWLHRADVQQVHSEAC